MKCNISQMVQQLDDWHGLDNSDRNDIVNGIKKDLKLLLESYKKRALLQFLGVEINEDNLKKITNYGLNLYEFLSSYLIIEPHEIEFEIFEGKKYEKQIVEGVTFYLYKQ